jgi:hypothetical protein
MTGNFGGYGRTPMSHMAAVPVSSHTAAVAASSAMTCRLASMNERIVASMNQGRQPSQRRALSADVLYQQK